MLKAIHFFFLSSISWNCFPRTQLGCTAMYDSKPYEGMSIVFNPGTPERSHFLPCVGCTSTRPESTQSTSGAGAPGALLDSSEPFLPPPQISSSPLKLRSCYSGMTVQATKKPSESTFISTLLIALQLVFLKL